MTLELALCIIAIVAAIVIGFKFKLNTGLIAACFAFIIGTTFQGLSATKIIAFWPTNLAYFIIICGLFFNFAVQNGTIDALGKKLLYLINGRAALIPWMIYIMGFIVGALGAGMPGITIVGILAFPLCKAAGIHPLACALSACAGAVIGINNPWTGQSGVTIMNLVDNAGGMPEQAMTIATGVFLSRVAVETLLVLIVFFATKCYKAKKVYVEKPEDFTPVQRKTFQLLIGCSAVIIVFVTLGLLFPKVPVCKALARLGQPQIMMTIGAVLAMILKLGDTNKAIKAIPINTALMVSGFTMMMNVAQNAGLVEALASVLSGNIPKFLLMPMFVLVGGGMSFFCSGTGVVFPLLFPLALPLSQTTGLNPAAIMIAVTLGSVLSSMSPFSTGGAMMLAGCPDNEAREKMSTTLIFVGIGGLIAGAVLAGFGFVNLFTMGV